MFQHYMQKSLFLALLFISLQNSIQAVEFTVENLNKGSCEKENGKYPFTIHGTFDEKTSYFSSFMLDLKTSNGDKIQAECSPIQVLLVYEFSCIIDISRYPLNNVNIIFPTTAPNNDKYTFKNWESIIGSNPGVSNVFKAIVCSPEAENTFVPNSITYDDCIIDYRTITIKGNWENSEGSHPIDYTSANIVIDTDNQDIADCNYKNSAFECKFRGEGRLKINEQFVTIFRKVYKIKGYDSGKSVKNCSDEDDDDFDWDGYFDNNLSSNLCLNKILIIVCLLLF